ncbi:hypothetical protein H9L13_04505 [Sphingomonas lutea]|uniref:Uncharacterized protein n=1 Tax=Sphingomonas lutea TaxID=1045317 RepID=A0A7G9SJX7_9SPHN|nr:hypothetical protein [Sphingomonas lutea]QNN68152.1 hypothetical protein H9L13_04505 [Sphingomonas lutea]
MIGTSTFATILEAPPSPTGDVAPQRNDFVSQEHWYARENGISVAEAKKRMADQQAISAEFEGLRARLAANESDNYTGVRMVHQPDWGYIFYFKRDAAATLARHTRNPRFRAAPGRFTDAEIKALVQPWAERFGKAGIMGGYGVDGTTGTAQMMMSVDREEYRAIAAREGWGTPPDGIALEFSRSLAIPAVDPRVAGLLRGFAYESRATVIQLEAGFSGRIILHDGCLRLGKADGPLVVFHRETGIGLDRQGYLALIDRHSGKPLGRIGEMMSWAGPNEAKDYVGLDALKAACGGNGSVINAGSPESRARFEARHPSSRSRG